MWSPGHRRSVSTVPQAWILEESQQRHVKAKDTVKSSHQHLTQVSELISHLWFCLIWTQFRSLSWLTLSERCWGLVMTDLKATDLNLEHHQHVRVMLRSCKGMKTFGAIQKTRQNRLFGWWNKLFKEIISDINLVWSWNVFVQNTL